MRGKLLKESCRRCPFRDKNKVLSIGPGEPKQIPLAILGEAPGQEEELDGRPFIGSAGQTLDIGLSLSGIQRPNLWIMNCLACRPPANNIYSDEAYEALVKCKKRIDLEIDYLKKRGLKVIIALGATAINRLGINESVSVIRGSLCEYKGITVIPTYHPSYMYRMHYRKKDSRVDLKQIWHEDLKKALRIATEGPKVYKENFIIDEEPNKIEAFLRALKPNNLLAVDIETVGLWRKDAEIICIGFARDAENALVFENIEEHRQLINKLLTSYPLMLQNALFDVPILQENGFRIPWSNVKHDTMLLHHAVSAELPHTLNFIASIYSDTAYWKGDLLNRTSTIKQMNKTVLHTYNARDCTILYIILPGSLKDLKELGKGNELAYQRSLRLLEPVSDMIGAGIKLSKKKLTEWITEIRTKALSLENILFRSMNLPVVFNLQADDDIRYFLFAEEPTKFKNLRDFDKKKPGTKVYENLKAVKNLKEKTTSPYILPNYSGRKTKKSGKKAVDQKGLLSYRIQLENRLKAIRNLKRPTEKHKTEEKKIKNLVSWIQTFELWRGFNKMITTYSRFPVKSDGRIHSSILIHGTRTGRFSSAKPNLQNIPSPKKDPLRGRIRNCLIAEQGNIFISGDYTNLEVYILAYEANEPLLIEALEKGTNIHDLNTEILFKVKKDHPKWKALRGAAKIFFFGGIAYGGGDREIYENIMINVPNAGLTFADYKAAKSNYISTMSGYKEWADYIVNRAFKQRYTMTFTGKKRILYGNYSDIRKEALNTPIQGGGADLINEALIRIHKRLDGYFSRVVLQIHDQIVIEAPVNEKTQTIKILKEELERPVDFKGKLISFPCDIEIGPSLGELKEWKQT